MSRNRGTCSNILRPVRQGELNIPRICFPYQALLTLTITITLSSHSNVFINLINQSCFFSSHQPAFTEKFQTWTSLHVK